METYRNPYCTAEDGSITCFSRLKTAQYVTHLAFQLACVRLHEETVLYSRASILPNQKGKERVVRLLYRSSERSDLIPEPAADNAVQDHQYHAVP
jgi:hypothetical protein